MYTHAECCHTRNNVWISGGKSFNSLPGFKQTCSSSNQFCRVLRNCRFSLVSNSAWKNSLCKSDEEDGLNYKGDKNHCWKHSTLHNTFTISFLTPWKEVAYALSTSSSFFKMSTAIGESSWLFTEISSSSLLFHNKISSSGPGCPPHCFTKSWIGSCFINPCNMK